MTAEEIFNMFFGGGMPGSSVYVRRGGRWHRQAGNMQEQQQVRIQTAEMDSNGMEFDLLIRIEMG